MPTWAAFHTQALDDECAARDHELDEVEKDCAAAVAAARRAEAEQVCGPLGGGAGWGSVQEGGMGVRAGPEQPASMAGGGPVASS